MRSIVATRLPTEWGTFLLHGFEAKDGDHVALTIGDVGGDKPVLIRIHSECLTGDALFSQRCDCGAQLKAAMEAIAGEGSGILLYLRQEGRGIGLLNKLRAYSLQDAGADTVDANEQLGFHADARNYNVCKSILEHFCVRRLRLMTNNPRKIDALRDLGFDVVERIPLAVSPSRHNMGYLSTKAARLGHMLPEQRAAKVADSLQQK